MRCPADANPMPTIKWYKDGARFLQRKYGRVSSLCSQRASYRHGSRPFFTLGAIPNTCSAAVPCDFDFYTKSHTEICQPTYRVICDVITQMDIPSVWDISWGIPHLIRIYRDCTSETLIIEIYSKEYCIFLIDNGSRFEWSQSRSVETGTVSRFPSVVWWIPCWVYTSHGLFCCVQFQQRKYLLKLPQVTVSDSGNYTCVLSNKYSSINRTFVVQVYGEFTIALLICYLKQRSGGML